LKKFNLKTSVLGRPVKIKPGG